MFFGKKEEKLISQPLNYWEEFSLVLVPYIDEDISKEAIINRLENNGIKVLGFAECSDEKLGRIVFEYECNQYEVNYIIENFDLTDLYSYQLNEFSEKEKNNIKKCTNVISICSDFSENFKQEYKVQLKIANSIIENPYVILDESAERILHPKFVKMLVDSKSLPSSTDLYAIQVISADNKIWMHTHGLNRFGITDLEILNSNQKNYSYHYNLMTTLADTLINKGLSEDNKYFIGYVSENKPLRVTFLPWTEGIEHYNGIDLGGLEDREEMHNTNYSIIFVYDGDKDCEENILSKVEIYDNQWENEPIYFYTEEETERMSVVARERFDYVRKYFSKEDKNVLLKLCIKTDDDDNEHMWFELLEINEDGSFSAKLMSEPYKVSSMKEGDIGTYTIDFVTDWILFLERTRYTPDKVYLLD